MSEHAREVRNALVDASRLCTALGLADGAKRQSQGLLIRCPVHGDRTPSCSVTPGPDGTLRVRCFACDWATDALGLIAAVRGWSLRIADDFRETLAEGAEIAGMLALEAEIRDGRPVPDRPRVAAPPPRPEPPYPDSDEVNDLWRRASMPEDDAEASRYLVGRKIDPAAIGERQIARVIAAPLPPWATYRGKNWIETGHRLVVRAFDAHGVARGVRAIQIRTSHPPKRLPPAGRKAKGLALVNRAACGMLRGDRPARVVVVEGEPDFMSWTMLTEEPVLGLVSGSWNENFAAAVPRDCRVIIRTHDDEAGDRYAKEIIESLAGKSCTIRRSSSEAA